MESRLDSLGLQIGLEFDRSFAVSRVEIVEAAHSLADGGQTERRVAVSHDAAVFPAMTSSRWSEIVGPSKCCLALICPSHKMCGLWSSLKRLSPLQQRFTCLLTPR